MKALLFKDGRKEANFTDFVKDLKENLMDQKNVSLATLVNQGDFILPAHRINKFLKTLIKEFKLHIEDGVVG